VLGTEFNGQAEIPQRFLPGLVRQAEHQIEIDVVEPAVAGEFETPIDVCHAMNSAECFQLVVIEGLYTERKPVDSGTPVGGQVLVLRGARVRFHGDLGIFREQWLKVGEDSSEGVRREEAGGSSTEEYRVDGSVRRLPLLDVEIEEQRIYVGIFV
jgi:hypothetical protein